MFDNTVDRSQNGMTNARDSETFSDLPVPDYSKFHDYLDDFDYYTGPVTATTTNGYTLSGTGATVAFAGADGGAINIIGATTAFIATLQRATATFKLESGKRVWFGSILSLDALTSQLIAGINAVGATPFTSVSDGVWFSSAVTTGALSLNYAVSSAVTTTALGVNVVAGSPLTLKWYWDGEIYGASPNGRIVYEVSGAGASANVQGEVLPVASFPSATLLAPQVGVKAAAGTPTLTLDLLAAIKERTSPLATPVF